MLDYNIEEQIKELEETQKRIKEKARKLVASGVVDSLEKDYPIPAKEIRELASK